MAQCSGDDPSRNRTCIKIHAHIGRQLKEVADIGIIITEELGCLGSSCNPVFVTKERVVCGRVFDHSANRMQR